MKAFQPIAESMEMKPQIPYTQPTRIGTNKNGDATMNHLDNAWVKVYNHDV